MSPSLYMQWGIAALAALLVLALLVAAFVGIQRRRSRTVAHAASERDPRGGWAPPQPPAPLGELADASLEARIAAWVATVPATAASGASSAPAGSEVRVGAGQVAGSTPASTPPDWRPVPAPERSPERTLEAAAPPTAQSTPRPLPEPVLQPAAALPTRETPAPVQAPPVPVPRPVPQSPPLAAPDHAAVAHPRFVGPVELWFGSTHVAVAQNTQMCSDLVRFANVMLDDLAAARGRAQ